MFDCITGDLDLLAPQEMPIATKITYQNPSCEITTFWGNIHVH